MRRLSDLSDRELAKLLNMTAAEVREWKEALGRRNPLFDKLIDPRPEWLEDDDWGNLKKIEEESERTNAQFWNLSVRRFEELRKAGGFNLANSFVRPAPEDAAGRFRALQDLLWREEEFETRYPAAFEVLYPEVARKRDRTGLLLPSFGVRVLNNWVAPRVQKQSEASGADAYTFVTMWQKESAGYSAGPHTGPLDLDDLQGVLLAILSREEFWERARWPKRLGGLTPVDGVELPKPPPIGLTDLRLVELLKPSVLKRGLRVALDQLHRPLSPEHVVLWKVRLLGSELVHGSEQAALCFSHETVARYLAKIPRGEVPEDALDYVEQVTRPRANQLDIPRCSRPLRAQTVLLRQHFDSEETGIAAVSFAAAALWLFLDLDTPDMQHAKSHRLAEQVEALAATLRKLVQGLRRATTDLINVVANRAAGRQPEVPRNNYAALCAYRRGFRDLRETAVWLGITPYSSRTGRGTRDWKARVRNRLREGVAFEGEHYPRAAAIFANRDNPIIRRKARRTYRKYIVELDRNEGYCSWSVLGFLAGVGKAETQRGREIASAYLQLGTCILRKIPPIP